MARLLSTIRSPADLKRLERAELPRLCDELREEIVATCARNGGHLGSSLGAVELNVALHVVLDTPRDRIVWDVGHQAYAHKLLTGRRERFHTLRTAGGLAGFPERDESEHDAFVGGHASNSVSAAVAMAEAREHAGGAGRVVAVLGDGALTGGLAFEGLNQAGWLGRRLVVVLNDNGMSISPNVGAASRWGDGGAKAFFESLGLHYAGPVPGHDVFALVRAVEAAVDHDGPVLLHVRTGKGHGYAPAERDAATRGHALSFFDPATGRALPRVATPQAYTDVFAQALCREMERDERVVAITAGMLEGTGLGEVRRRFPRRTYDVGIAEAHAVTFAAGLACEGLRPVVAIYSTFLQRAFDSIVHDVALQRLPVTFALDRGGLVGADGKTHQGALDLSWLRCVPDLVLMAPSDENELRRLLRTALEHPGPAALRFPRRASFGLDEEPADPVEPGAARLLRAGGPRPDVLLAAAGAPARAALAAAEALARDGIDAAVLDARFVKPLDADAVCALAASARRVVTIEESSGVGGFGAAVLEALAAGGVLEAGVKVARLALPDAFVPHGDVASQLAELRLDAAGIAREARALVGLRRNERGAA